MEGGGVTNQDFLPPTFSIPFFAPSLPSFLPQSCLLLPTATLKTAFIDFPNRPEFIAQKKIKYIILNSVFLATVKVSNVGQAWLAKPFLISLKYET